MDKASINNMKATRFFAARLFPAIILMTTTFAPAGRGTIIWTGPPVAFTNVAGSDPTLAVNQDRITPNVWITRGGSQGIYNAKTESGFTHFFSPADTEWANGTTANYNNLTYTDWNSWARGVNPSPPSTVGVNAVVHLISEDIYIDVQFTSWAVGSGFSYVRSTPPPPPLLVIAPSGGPNSFDLAFTNTSGLTINVVATTNLALPLANWPIVGTMIETPPGSGAYQFADPGALTNSIRKFYRLQMP